MLLKDKSVLLFGDTRNIVCNNLYTAKTKIPIDIDVFELEVCVVYTHSNFKAMLEIAEK